MITLSADINLRACFSARVKQNKMYEYFDRKSSEWSIQGFLDECELEPLKKKTDCYIKCLAMIVKSGEGKRSETAQELLDRYRTASIRIFFVIK